MVIMTAKVSKSKRIAAALIVLIAVILLVVCLSNAGKTPRSTNRADTAPAAHGAGGFPSLLPQVQIYLRDPFPGRENRRNQNARRLDAVHATKMACTAFTIWGDRDKRRIWRNTA